MQQHYGWKVRFTGGKFIDRRVSKMKTQNEEEVPLASGL
jgi:hypothetical protein